jgi:hypothetical protein
MERIEDKHCERCGQTTMFTAINNRLVPELHSRPDGSPCGERGRWLNDHRPGYFGRSRDAKVAALDATLGKGNWRLAWVTPKDVEGFEFVQACEMFYEESYYQHLKDRTADIDFICSFGECIDNAPSNVRSGFDYSVQESYSTHIQDIAIRNVLRRLGRKFEGPSGKLLIIRSPDSEGFRFGPGNIPFAWPDLITQPSLCPKWANEGSVEDFWQSAKHVQVLAP